MSMELVKNLVSAGVNWLGFRRQPTIKGALAIKGLQGRVDIHRDGLGIPHIYAGSLMDLVFAQGYAHAQDRLWQMDYQRRLAAGRLSHVVGKTARQLDIWMRILGFEQLAHHEARLLPDFEQEMLQSYANGVNAGIQQEPLPVEFTMLDYTPDPWRVEDTLLWSKMMAWQLSGNADCEILRWQIIRHLGRENAMRLELTAEESWALVMDLPGVQQLQERLSTALLQYGVASGGEAVGSNNWVISGSRTNTGKPILANDMHLPLMTPAVWYENHLESPGFRVTGVSMPGAPLVVSGHNGRVAWGFTSGFADVQDLYEEHLRQTGTGWEYEYCGHWLPADVRVETIQVRMSEPVVHTVISTHHGPIINDLANLGQVDPPLALRWTALEHDPGIIHSLFAINHAQNGSAMRRAVQDWTSPVQNLVYADTEGEIGYQLIGRVPVRSAGNGKEPVPGWNGDFEWNGTLPFTSMPCAINPQQGFIVTANNRTTSRDYPHYLGDDYVSSDRATRITEMILSSNPVDIETVKDMQFDLVSPSARRFVAAVSKAGVPDDPDARLGMELLRAWDGQLSANSPAAAVYQHAWRRLIENILNGRLGNLQNRYLGEAINVVFGHSLWASHSAEWLQSKLGMESCEWFPSRAEKEDMLASAIAFAVKSLQESHGADPVAWGWGNQHQTSFGHIFSTFDVANQAFSRGPFPSGGDGTTIWASNHQRLRMDRHDHQKSICVGPPFRFIADLADLDHCLGLLGPGQSGRQGSPHYDDQVDAWFTRGYHVMWFHPDDVHRETHQLLTLLPGQITKSR